MEIENCGKHRSFLSICCLYCVCMTRVLETGVLSISRLYFVFSLDMYFAWNRCPIFSTKMWLRRNARFLGQKTHAVASKDDVDSCIMSARWICWFGWHFVSRLRSLKMLVRFHCFIFNFRALVVSYRKVLIWSGRCNFEVSWTPNSWCCVRRTQHHLSFFLSLV